MRIESIVSFCAVVEEGSFQGAASSLFLTQPAVSMNIKQLEKEFGQPLLLRKRRGEIELTPIGKEFYTLSVSLRDKVEELETLKRESLQQLDFQITVDCNVTAGIYWLTSKISEFQIKHKNVHISVNHTNDDQSVTNLLNEKTDLALLLSPPHYPQLSTIMTWEDELKVIIPKTVTEPVSFLKASKIKEQAFILPSKGLPTRKIIDKIFKKHLGTKPKCIFETSNPETIKRSVISLQNPGIILASTLNQGDLNMFNFINTDLNMHCNHVLLEKKKRFHSKAFHQLIDFLLSGSVIR